MAHIFQRGKRRTWWIKYYVNGRQVYHSLNTANARLARQIRRRIEGEQATGELVAPSKTPLPALLADYCRFMSTTQTPKSYSSDVSVLRVFFGPICPPLQLGSCVNRRYRGAAPKRLSDTKSHLHVQARTLE